MAMPLGNVSDLNKKNSHRGFSQAPWHNRVGGGAQSRTIAPIISIEVRV